MYQWTEEALKKKKEKEEKGLFINWFAPTNFDHEKNVKERSLQPQLSSGCPAISLEYLQCKVQYVRYGKIE